MHVFIYLITGSVSDGEFSSLRTRGETRPLHIWQLMRDSRESVQRQSQEMILSMLVKTGGEFSFLQLLTSVL